MTTKNGKARADLARRLGESTSELGPAPAVCDVAVEMLGLDGPTLTLIVAPGCPFVIGATLTWVRMVEELAYTAGDGPCGTAARTGVVSWAPPSTLA